MDSGGYTDIENAALRARYAAVFAPRGRTGWALAAAALALLAFGLWHLGFSPGRFFSGLNRLGDFIIFMFPPDWGNPATLKRFLRSLGETVAIAFLGTLLAAIFALPLSLLAARNTTVSQFLRFFTRRSFDTLRGVDTLIWALIWINVVGLGPFAGVLAIAISDIGSLGKLFSEAIEASDERSVEGVKASGGAKLHGIRFGLLPQVAPVLIGQVLYFFESNTRSATILGIVGAGGIGLEISEMIRTLEWQKVAFLIIMILITVSVIDRLSSLLRNAIAGSKAAPI
ncbi:phosphonate ABC transporter, permease protein PhnE [Aestuariivirga sp.]|uniref:phosphonate ABC transporter, permease protein PhnE n=1 Tax=Aestuariivirga sp. TaxID=2650926 RepID=UPI0025B8D8EE|nr:phosphonate ABC transporter, permease protein PhnE [Aestuariivirga sp.]MCA3555343.1 phosphonate ABC transporter, permease protein PhnE [Aestuariivirga sp.]